jgi:hypothetical protein
VEQRLIGRQAPVKRCLARYSLDSAERFAELAFCSSSKWRNKFAPLQRIFLGVRKQQLHVLGVGLVDERQLLQLTHAARLLGTEQVTLARMHSQNFPGGRDLKTLLRAAVSLQFHFWFRAIPRHCGKSSLLFFNNFYQLAEQSSSLLNIDQTHFHRARFADQAGFATGAPFLGASSATRTLPSMRGMVSIWPCSPISPSKRVILARPTSWCAISRPR